MQFTTSTIALIAALMASQVSGMPTDLFTRANTCGATPSASGTQTPLSSPTAVTADACQAACESNASCKSFAFGLPPNSDAPVCKLFSVAAAQVSAQDTNVVVYDLACSSVPNTEPTTASPHGEFQESGTTEQTGNQQQQQQQQKRDICGAKPTGSGTAPTPLKTNAAITSSDACLALGQSTVGCKSVEFGKFNAGEAQQCRLFNVAAAQLPPPTAGQSFVAFDIAC
ncbi:uncharacterized protein BCR38DRAFT_345152 [Pseudomassariella vexata]|uniref:Apple domain-containing protein n=1 Tax=Pseudomassariella vexata TaxID=1141098 RepID=A0A1Y2DW08_9PEZI|nr:uncharacterized protein BCR38DRAFT_488445 [Pseudomassariella vexata]XP_040715026.1 uncharacterized protein BCR38DRAFT_345152 [Pseudomassariella vexata]ORY60265.1 hypothetical protein BCR38DRAFT_488445 [Pseudomassariella vexata]ORY63369.1 hypothetical protein BCR38DRAFT_345152 [Pseudomassariella vexata]